MELSSIIFPEASRSISTTLATLKRTNLSITNRLHSIALDAEFVEELAHTHSLPLVANERCGSWYIPASQKEGSVYFKSTDGHHEQWSFSLRRLNLQVLDLVGLRGGCIIVDSTRRGKTMPDALSKTVPIWICVLNRVLFPYDAEAGRLRTPEDVVSRSEHTQIEERVLAFVKDTRSLMLDLCALRQKLDGRPMVPVWVTPDMSLSSLSSEAGRNRVVLCTAASGQTMSASSLGSAYVQGAADDSESWALGLDAASFWTHTERLLSASEDELPNTIEKILSGGICEADHSCTKPSLIGPGSTIWIAKNSAVKRCVQTFDIVIYCSENIIDEMEPEFTKRCIQLSCGVGKVGSRQLRSQLPKIERLSDTLSSKSKVLVTCPTGKDLAVGVALALICSYCNDKGELNSCQTSKSLNKTMIKHRLSWIMISMPDAAPSRATLQSVNAFLLG